MDRSQQEILVAGAAAMGVALDEVAKARFAAYLSLLQEWGRKINLTSHLDTEEVIVHHFLDSLAGAPAIGASGGVRVVDIGAGAGLPSLPLKFALPELQLLLVESVRKKVAFCQEVVRRTGISGVEVAWGRAEEIASKSGHSQSFDWAVSRAVGASADVAAIALPFLATRGRILLYKGSPGEEELKSLDSFCSARGCAYRLHKVVVPRLDGARCLITVSFPDGGGQLREG